MDDHSHGKFAVGGFYYICAFAPYKTEPRIGIETVVFNGLVPRPEMAVRSDDIPEYYSFTYYSFPGRNAKSESFYIKSLQDAEMSVLTIAELVEDIADLEQQIKEMPPD